MTTSGLPRASPALRLVPFWIAWSVLTGFLVSCSSAFSNLVIFSAMLASSASATSLLWRANNCAANLPILAGFTMKALEDPGGLVRQVLFIPSGGQDTTGNFARYDAVPERASVPPAQPTIMTGELDL